MLSHLSNIIEGCGQSMDENKYPQPLTLLKRLHDKQYNLGRFARPSQVI